MVRQKYFCYARLSLICWCFEQFVYDIYEETSEYVASEISSSECDWWVKGGLMIFQYKMTETIREDPTALFLLRVS